MKLYSYSDINLKIITIKIENTTSENKSNRHLEKQQNPFISLTRKRTTIYIFHLYMFWTEPNDTYALCATHQTSITSIYLWGNMITYIYHIHISILLFNHYIRNIQHDIDNIEESKSLIRNSTFHGCISKKSLNIPSGATMFIKDALNSSRGCYSNWTHSYAVFIMIYNTPCQPPQQHIAIHINNDNARWYTCEGYPHAFMMSGIYRMA